MIKKILIILFIIAALLIIAYEIIDSTRIRKQQSQEIKKKFATDSTFKLDDLTNIPLLLFENDKLKKDYFIILFPGDGGWRDFTDSLARIISNKGINVIGFNTIPYFDSLRSPGKIAKDVGRVIRNFSHALNKKHVILGGYSFSAEILPFVYNNLDTAYKNKVSEVFMIAPSTEADFKVSPIYYYSGAESKAVYPELLKTDKKKFLIFCDEQKQSLCKVIESKYKFNTIDLHSGHMFTHIYRKVAETICKNIIY